MNDQWKFFNKIEKQGSQKSDRAKCKLCPKTVSAASRNMDTHIRTFYNKKRSIGVPGVLTYLNAITSVPLNQDLQNSLDGQTSIKSQAVSLASFSGPLSHIIGDVVQDEENAKIDLNFAKAIHETATSFCFFEHTLGYTVFFIKIFMEKSTSF